MEWLQEELLPSEGNVFSSYGDDEITEADKDLYWMMALGAGNGMVISKENWKRCLYLCTLAGNTQLYGKLWNEYPEFVENMMREFEEKAASVDLHITEEEIKASWKRFEARMKAEGIF